LFASHSSHFTPWGKSPTTHWTGGWVGHKADLDTLHFSCPCQEFNHNSSIVQTIAWPLH
jgi:hypothetical protein